ncbi:Calcium/calmodulin-dependent 3',5'-cyclic nucleotide phosphodiesterase 1C [Sparganum proliferum]
MIIKAGLCNLLSQNETFALMFSALIHDYEHTGTTNAYQVNLSTHLALFYNDRNVQENHHISAAFRAAQLPGLNIFVNVAKKDYQEIRQLSIEMVLNTDVSLHFCQVKSIGQQVKFEKPFELLAELIQRLLEDYVKIRTSEDPKFVPTQNDYAGEFQWAQCLANNKMMWQSQTGENSVKSVKPT